MRDCFAPELERWRVRSGDMASEPGATFGAFTVHARRPSLFVIASDGGDWPFGGVAWEHVSVSTLIRCPTWDEMELVRSWCWRDDELVLQLSVPRSKHINHHIHCLHLWKPIGVEIPMPPAETIVTAAQVRAIAAKAGERVCT